MTKQEKRIEDLVNKLATQEMDLSLARQEAFKLHELISAYRMVLKSVLKDTFP